MEEGGGGALPELWAAMREKGREGSLRGGGGRGRVEGVER